MTHHNRILKLALAVAMAFGGCVAGSRGPIPSPDPSKDEVRLEGASGFDAYLLHQSDVGVWTVKSVPLFPWHGCPAVVALDDKGRCIILTNYSGRWTPWTVTHDGKWLGGLAHADIDPRVSGAELYVGGQQGNLYQVRAHPQGGFDSRVIAYLPGREIHTIVAGDLDAGRIGQELLVFTSPGAFYLVEPETEERSEFRCTLVGELASRVRDAVLLPSLPGRPSSVVTVSRGGEASMLSMHAGKPTWRRLLHEPVGLGRVAMRPGDTNQTVVLYITCDDGRVIRLELEENGQIAQETIYSGPQGPRGIAAGRFHVGAQRESVVVFGYSREVVLLSREQQGWKCEKIFTDTEKGHWLSLGELDTRNATDEILLCGFGARVVMLARPPDR